MFRQAKFGEKSLWTSVKEKRQKFVGNPSNPWTNSTCAWRTKNQPVHLDYQNFTEVKSDHYRFRICKLMYANFKLENCSQRILATSSVENNVKIQPLLIFGKKSTMQWVLSSKYCWDKKVKAAILELKSLNCSFFLRNYRLANLLAIWIQVCEPQSANYMCKPGYFPM